MKRVMSSKVLRLALQSLLAITIVVLAHSVTTAQLPQVTQKMLTLKTLPNEPVEVSNLRVNSQAALFGKPINAPDDWLKGLTFDVRNTSGKTITYIHMRLLIDSSDQLKTPGAFSLFRGVLSKEPDGADVEKYKSLAIALKQGDSVRFEITGQRYTQLKNFLEEAGLQGETASVGIIINMVVFDDDTAWISGVMVKRDPNNPLRWVALNRMGSLTPQAPRVNEVGMFNAVHSSYKAGTASLSPRATPFLPQSYGCSEASEYFIFRCAGALHSCYNEDFIPYDTGQFAWSQRFTDCFD